MLVSLAEMREYLLVFIDWSIAITAPLLYFLYFFFFNFYLLFLEISKPSRHLRRSSSTTGPCDGAPCDGSLYRSPRSHGRLAASKTDISAYIVIFFVSYVSHNVKAKPLLCLPLWI